MSHTNKLELHRRYGGYALVTGGARGIGRAFAEELATAGFDIVLIDREIEDGNALANELHAKHGVDAQLIVCDLAKVDLAAEAAQWAARHDIGLLVCNAGISPIGGFFEIPLDTHLETLDVNARATLTLTHVIGRAMVERGRGAIVVVSSASAISGAPYSANYAATKGFGLNLATSIWAELRGTPIDVLAVCPGLTNTTPVKERGLDQTVPFVVPLHGPGRVARGALRALGRQPVIIPTLADRLSSALMARGLPRSWSLSLVRRSMEQLQGRKNRK